MPDLWWDYPSEKTKGIVMTPEQEIYILTGKIERMQLEVKREMERAAIAEGKVGRLQEAIGNWKRWHRTVAGVLGLEYIERNATLEAIKAVTRKVASAKKRKGNK